MVGSEVVQRLLAYKWDAYAKAGRQNTKTEKFPVRAVQEDDHPHRPAHLPLDCRRPPSHRNGPAVFPDGEE